MTCRSSVGEAGQVTSCWRPVQGLGGRLCSQWRKSSILEILIMRLLPTMRSINVRIHSLITENRLLLKRRSRDSRSRSWYSGWKLVLLIDDGKKVTRNERRGREEDHEFCQKRQRLSCDLEEKTAREGSDSSQKWMHRQSLPKERKREAETLEIEKKGNASPGKAKHKTSKAGRKLTACTPITSTCRAFFVSEVVFF